MKLYKLTDANGWTYGGTQWGPGVTHSVEPCDNPRLCTGDVLHAYQDADLALLMNPAHAYYQNARVWEAEGEPCVTKPDKLGCFSLTTVGELDAPAWFADKAIRRRVQVRFAILAARAVLDVFESKRPADHRPRKAIEAAEKYLATGSAWRADDAANAADDADNAADAAAAAAFAADAANAAANAANAAAYAANAANAALDLAVLARQAVTEELGGGKEKVKP